MVKISIQKCQVYYTTPDIRMKGVAKTDFNLIFDLLVFVLCYIVYISMCMYFISFIIIMYLYFFYIEHCC